jgi:hypothetical protein
MNRSARTRLALSITAAAAIATAGTLAAATMASAHNAAGMAGMPGTAAQPAAVTTADTATYLVASMEGRNEVPVPTGPKVGDPDGQAFEVLRIKGDQVSFAMKWRNIAAPTAGHVHAGALGVNGPVKIGFFGTALPDTVSAAVGSVTADRALVDDLKANPGNFYANLHTAEFPGGAVRGQFHKLTHPADLDGVLRGGPFSGLLDGDQEVPGAAPVGDPDGHATTYVKVQRDRVDYAFSWNGIAPPTNGHIHQGSVGVNGPVVVPLFAAPAGLPASFTGIAGSAGGLKSDLTDQIRRSPAGFYANLHTAEFAGGAVRGQLFRAGGDQPANFTASVIDGAQIYACTSQPDGTFAFTQHNVRASLQGGIKHSFVTDDAGPPQWVAPDGSAVTGKLVAKTPNGANNIAELDLDLTQSGRDSGLLADAVEVLRLNTVGGVAPAGTCDPARQPIAKVPYQADYVFITR